MTPSPDTEQDKGYKWDYQTCMTCGKQHKAGMVCPKAGYAPISPTENTEELDHTSRSLPITESPELAILAVIDTWYHEHTRHHLVDVDQKVLDSLIKPLASREHQAAQAFGEKVLGEKRQHLFTSGSNGNYVTTLVDAVPVSVITSLLGKEK